MTSSILPLISVITPCLDAISTIGRTLESVRRQEYPSTEHIVVDGGSTDGTLEFLLAQPDLILISEPDEGLSDALNKGFRRSTGALIGWLNADDLYLPNALHTVARAHLDQPEARWVTGHCRIIGAEDEEIRPLVTKYKSFLLERYRYGTFLMQNYVSAPATFLTRQGLEEVGEARVDQRYSMDYDLWLRAGRRSRPVVVPQQLAAFRMVEGTLSMSGFEKQFREHSEIASSFARTPVEKAAAFFNRRLSRAIVLTYRGLAKQRERERRRST